MLKSYLISLLILTGILSATPVVGQDLKVGYVDKTRVLKEAPQSEVARNKLKQEFSPRDEKIVEMQKRLKSLSERQEKDSPLLSKSDGIKLEREIVSLRRDIKRAKEEFTEDFNLRRNEELARLHKLIAKTSIDIAKEQRYDVILSDNVMFISKRVDITDVVISRLRQYQKSSRSSDDNAK